VNYLFHLFLSGNDPQLLVGNLMGDFVKGRLDDRYPAGILQGLRLHRRIDTFAAGNGHFRASKQRLDPACGHFRGVMVDLFYDHFLAADWAEFSPLPLPDFLWRARRTAEDFSEILPERLRAILPRLFAVDWLPAYREAAGVARALERMGERVRRTNPLARGGRELARNYDALQVDFRGFLPEVSAFAAGERLIFGSNGTVGDHLVPARRNDAP
jgi:acyl carrier protein phosphodiesterase